MSFATRARYITSRRPVPVLLGFLTIFILCISWVGGCGGPSKEQIQAWHETAVQVQSLDRLSTRLFQQGRYAEAEPFARRIIETIEMEVGPDNLKLAQPRNNLAVIYEKMGDGPRAEFNYLRVLNILDHSLGSGNPKVGEAMIGIAGFYERAGRLEEARGMLERARDLLTAALGEKHPIVAKTALNLADVDRQLGNTERAGQLYEQVLEKAGRQASTDEPVRAEALLGLSESRRKSGDFEIAAGLRRDYMAIAASLLGPDHPRLASLHASAAVFFHRIGKPAEAQDHAGKALGAIRRLDWLLLGFADDVRKRDFLEEVKADIHFCLWLSARENAQESLKSLALEAWWQLECAEFEGDVRFHAAPFISGPDDVRTKLKEYYQVLVEYNEAVFSGLRLKDKEAGAKRLKDLTTRLTAKSDGLAALSGQYAAQEMTRRADRRSVAGSLPPGTALLDFARVDPRLGPPSDAKGEGAVYLAFLLKHGQPDAVQVFSLGPAETIDREVRSFRREAVSGRSGLAARRLHGLLIRPILASLAGFDRLAISPDAGLSWLPFEALTDEKNRYLLQNFDVSYLSNGRESAFGPASGEFNPSIVAVANPDYNLAAADASEPGSPADRLLAPDMKSLVFRNDPGASGEIGAVSAAAPPDKFRLMTGMDADEDRLTRLTDRPGVWHLAVAGFLLPDAPPRDPNGPGPGLLLDRSGLALTGANVAVHGSNLRNHKGLLLSSDILGWLLSDVRLVFLPGFQTPADELAASRGLGAVIRSFRRAGAENSVARLWKGTEAEDRRLIGLFYHRLAARSGRVGAALRDAKLEILNEQIRRAGRGDPRAWAGLVHYGTLEKAE